MSDTIQMLKEKLRAMLDRQALELRGFADEVIALGSQVDPETYAIAKALARQALGQSASHRQLITELETQSILRPVK